MRSNLLSAVNWTIVLAVAAAWKFLEVEGAGNLITAFCWFVGLMGIVLFAFTPTKPTTPALTGFLAHYTRAIFWLLVFGLVWFGHPGLAVLLGMLSFGMHCHRQHFNADGTLKAKD